jgi:hypothetical protein
MEMTTDAVALISARCKKSNLVQEVTGVHLLGDLVAIGYTVDDQPYVMTEYLRPASTVPAQIVDAVRRGLQRGRCSASVNHDMLQCEPIKLSDGCAQSISDRFSRTRSFKALNVWIVGNTYLVHGEFLQRPCLVTGNYHGPATIHDSVQLAIEIDALQYLTTSYLAGYSIRIDGYEFHLPRG